ncbi:MAG: MotA/TolQ/ExbB proton channel family protein [Lachnospiraceae bacterium]|nr:MotA/TolQ/ExbB proton channel family protein [Lachnospiraceae bacterium]
MALEIALNNLTFIDAVIIVTFIAALVLCVVIFVLHLKEKHKTDTAELFYRFLKYAIDALPLLGTLGTVIGLINNSINADALQSNFLYALTSTFWGLVGAIILKFLDEMWISKLMQD